MGRNFIMHLLFTDICEGHIFVFSRNILFVHYIFLHLSCAMLINFCRDDNDDHLQ